MNISKRFTEHFRLTFALIKAHKMQKNIYLCPMVYISEIYFCMVKSGNLSTIFTIFYKQNDRVAMATHYAFSVDQFTYSPIVAPS